jgi:hypothetical protein
MFNTLLADNTNWHDYNRRPKMITKKTIITLVTLIFMIALAVTSSVYTITAHGATEDTDAYTVRPDIYLGGYGYTAETPSQYFIHEDIKKNNRLLIDIYKMLEDFDVRIAGIEKALNIEPSQPAKGRPSSASPAKKTRIYSTD